MSNPRNKPLLESMPGNGRNNGLLITLMIGIGVASCFSPQYFSLDNLFVVALQVSFVGIAALGMTFLIVGGNVDLSIGSQYALCAVSAAMLAKIMPAQAAWGSAILLGGALGLLNGLLVWRVPISPIIITLGMMTIYRGIALRMTEGFGVRGVPKSFSGLGRAEVLNIPLPVWILIVTSLIAFFTLSYTTQGRHLLAYGGNKQAAEAAGISGKRILLSTFAVNGMMVAISGVLAASRFGTAAPTFGTGFELDVIAAVILGGVAFTGGEGSVVGVILAVLLLGVINSVLIAVGVDPHYTQIVKGGALVVAVTLDQFMQEQQERHRKKLALQERSQPG